MLVGRLGVLAVCVLGPLAGAHSGPALGVSFWAAFSLFDSGALDSFCSSSVGLVMHLMITF